MRRSMFFANLFFALLFVAGPSGSSVLRADTIFKKDGTEVVGKVVQEEEKRVLVEIQMGKMAAKVWIDRKDISRIEKGRTPTDVFQERLAELAPHDIEGHRALAGWANEQSLFAEERYVTSLLPKVELAARKHTHPRTWCRACDADGESICSECEGKGKVIENCSRCVGKGTLPCKTCEGDAKSTVRCKRCAGEGEYERFDPGQGKKVKTACPDCRGKGTRECPTCNGKGSTECPLCEGDKGEVHECEACAGKPKQVCATCEGKGLQPTPVTDEQLAKEMSEAERKAAEETAKKLTGEKKPGEPEETKPEPVIKGNPFGGG